MIHRLDNASSPYGRPTTPGHTSLRSIETRRAHLWAVAALLIVSLSLAILLLFVGDDLSAVLPQTPALRWSFLGVSLAFIAYVVDQERRLRRLTEALVDERVLTAALESRIADLAALTSVGRVVNSVLSLEEVLEVIINSVFELTGATKGSVMLRQGDVLEVAASAGEYRAPVGATSRLGDGVAGWVAQQREPVLITGRLGEDQFPGHGHREGARGSSVIAPLIAAGELLGVLAVERPAGGPAFEESELRSVALFAEHAATAVSNAYRYGEERETVQRLASVLEQRAEFVATMVHELKTPLSVILGFSSVLETRGDSMTEARRAESFAAIRTQGDRLQAMVDEILRSASAEAGADVRREPVDLADLLTRLIDSIATVSEDREGVGRLFRLAGAERRVTVYGDAEALYRVFENLVENAVKYSPSGSPVEVAIEQRPHDVRVTVTDHGEGIPSEEVETVFERFRRRERTVTGGVGLGLYIVRVLVNAHGGRVWVDSDPGRGASFTVSLPIREDDRDPSRSPAVEVATASAPRG